MKAYGQVRISNDSLYVNNELGGTYSLDISDPNEFVIRTFVLKGIRKVDREVFEALVNEDLKSKGLLKSANLKFQYRQNKVPKTNNEPLSEIANDIEGAGRLYNAAVTLSFIAVGGSTLVAVIGFPVAGVVISLAGGVAALATQISGNNKLISAGQKIRNAQILNSTRE